MPSRFQQLYGGLVKNAIVKPDTKSQSDSYFAFKSDEAALDIPEFFQLPNLVP